MSVRMFEEFQKKNNAFNFRRLRQNVNDDEKFCIQIPLKNSQKLKGRVDENGVTKLDEDFIKVIEYEYAVRYLEKMGTAANAQSIQKLLKIQPLSSCELSSGWNNSGALADVLFIYPMKGNKKTFDEHKDELGFASKPKVFKVKKTDAQLEQERLQDLKDEEFGWKQKLGLINEFTDDDQLKRWSEQLKHMQKVLPSYKQHTSALTFDNMQKEQEDERVEKKWKELNMGIDQWKAKYLYPFGDISPITESDLKTQANTVQTQRSVSGFPNDSIMSSASFNNQSLMHSQSLASNISQMPDDAFVALTKLKYQFPVIQIQKQQHLSELQNPLDLKIQDIQSDFNKFVKDFPIDIIPHHNTHDNRQQSKQNKLHYSYLSISDKQISLTFEEIKYERVARLTGLLAHFVYWCVFGHINESPLDEYHLKQLFISISQALSQLNIHYSDQKKLFSVFIMPMILLAIRVEMEVILKVAYPTFMDDKQNEIKTMRLVNGVITELLDPMIFFSRFSFLESGKQAIELKAKIAQQKQAKNETSAKQKFFTRSAIMKSLVPLPSEGKVRAKFCETKDPSKRNLSQAGSQAIFGQIPRSQNIQQTSFLNQKSQMIEPDQDSQLLDLINRVQMFQIVGTRVNQSLISRKMDPVFNLKYADSFTTADQ